MAQVVGGSQPQEASTPVYGRWPGGTTEVALAAIAEHAAETENVHGFADTAAVVDTLATEIDDGPDFALIWANLMA